MRRDFVIDMETLGLETGCPIIQIGLVLFDIKNEGAILGKWLWDVEIDKDSMGKANTETICWWLETNVDLFKSIMTSPNKKPLQLVLEEVYGVLEAYPLLDNYLWGNGTLFDNAKLKHAYEKYGGVYPIHYRNDRDMRTIVDLACEKLACSSDTLMKGIETPICLMSHQALDDCIKEAIRIAYCYKVLMGGIDSKINLCDNCTEEIAICDYREVIYGNGNDNIIFCVGYHKREI